MNKLVYLFELDSVRNSEQEIIKGQRALFEEIVLNGNQVVLSFNQLTDSETFLNLLMKEETYQCVVELFKMGALKVSLFRRFRTPSQYVQEAIEKCRSGKTTFLFSGIPIFSSEDGLLEKLELALRYNDIGLLRELFQSEEDAGNEEECKRIRFLIRYIQLILILSSEEYATNLPKSQINRSFIQYMDLVLEHSDAFVKSRNRDTSMIPSYKKAIKLLIDIREQFNADEQKSGINNRSDWVQHIVAYGESDDVCIANAIIDLCYNYTIEESVLNVSRHYDCSSEDSFVEDFASRLVMYLQEWKDGVHVFPTKDIQRNMQVVDSKVAWNTAIRVVRNTKRKSETMINLKRVDEVESILYETNYGKEKKIWISKAVLGIVKHFLVTLVYIILFGITELMMNKLEGFIENAQILSGIWYDIIISIVVFSILGSVFSEITNLPDLLESFKNIGKGIVDCVNLVRAKKNVAYRKM